MNVLVDSCVFISLLDKSDSNHKKANEDLEILIESGDRIWITEHILDEVINILQKKNLNKQLRHFISQVNKDEIMLFLPNDREETLELVTKTYSRVLKQRGKKASFTDLYSMVVVEEEYLPKSKLLSYDHHLNNGKTRQKFRK